MNQLEQVTLLIADISGYTEYLAGVEIDHAQDILADLIGTVVTSLRPAFRLAKLEGDAAFCFAPADKVDGSTLLDTIERCYFSFRRRRRDVRAATSCECNACMRIPTLNLKFVAHRGVVIRQKVAGHEELLGSDVIVLHRLLKNDIVETLGVPAYAALTATLTSAVGIDPAALGMTHHSQAYEHVGEVPIWVLDLEKRWQEEESRQRVYFSPADAAFNMELQINAPPQVVWDFLTTPGRRLGWQGLTGTTGIEQQPGDGGRRGAGTVTHCAHGEAMVIEEILDYRPNDYITMRSTNPLIPFKLVMMFELEPTGTGTHMSFRVERPKKPEHVAALEQFGTHLGEALTAAYHLMGVQAVTEAKELTLGPPQPALLEARNADGFLNAITPIQMLN
ncbi:MAG: DUF2652 domain-containing protein [Chloroflexota bacterium]